MQHPVRRTLGVLAITAAATFSVVHVLASDASPNLARALEAQQSLALANPSDADVHNDLGNLLALAGHLSDAEGAYQRAIDLRSDLVSPRFNMGLLMQQQGRTGDARNAFEAVLGIDPSHAWARYQLGVVHDERGDERSAIEQYARAFALDHRLAFAKHNPQVIDNQLLTQSLLRAREFSPPTVSQAPRQYGDPERIADLMLDDQADQGAAEAEIETEGVERMEGAAREAQSSGRDAAIDEEDDFFDDDPGPSDIDQAAGRTLSAEDLDAGSRVGQAGSNPAARSDARTRRGPGSVLERYRRNSSTPSAGSAGRDNSGTATLPSSATRGRSAAGRDGSVSAERRSTVGGGAAGRTRFNPSVRSSGSLELELRPVTPGAEPAAVAAVITR